MAMSFVMVDENTSHSQRVLQLVATEGACVPGHWQYEIANALFAAERRGRLTEANVVHALQGLRQLPISHHSPPLSSLRVIALARQFGLSVYDAAYLDLALELNLPLATLDKELQQAAALAGVKLTT